VTSTTTLRYRLWPEPYGIARLRSLPSETHLLRREGPPVAIIAGHDEVSVLAPEAVIDSLGELVERHDRGWRALTLDAVFELTTVGLLAAVARTLASVDIPVMVVSTYDTDHLLVPGARLGHALAALGQIDLERFVHDA
jgi:uncharacterized protein